jgi:hypothetical protein
MLAYARVSVGLRFLHPARDSCRRTSSVPATPVVSTVLRHGSGLLEGLRRRSTMPSPPSQRRRSTGSHETTVDVWILLDFGRRSPGSSHHGRNPWFELEPFRVLTHSGGPPIRAIGVLWSACCRDCNRTTETGWLTNIRLARRSAIHRPEDPRVWSAEDLQS